jgi:hypothetical protein
MRVNRRWLASLFGAACAAVCGSASAAPAVFFDVNFNSDTVDVAPPIGAATAGATTTKLSSALLSTPTVLASYTDATTNVTMGGSGNNVLRVTPLNNADLKLQPATADRQTSGLIRTTFDMMIPTATKTGGNSAATWVFTDSLNPTVGDLTGIRLYITPTTGDVQLLANGTFSLAGGAKTYANLLTAGQVHTIDFTVDLTNKTTSLTVDGVAKANAIAWSVPTITPTWKLSGAAEVNDLGGNLIFDNFNVSVPEPASLGTLAGGLLLLARRQRRA